MTTTDATGSPSIAVYGHSLNYCPDPDCTGNHVGGLPMGYAASLWRTRQDLPTATMRKNRGYARCPEHGVIIGPAGHCPHCAI